MQQVSPLALVTAASLTAVVVAGFALRKAYGPRNLLGKYQGLIISGFAVLMLCVILFVHR
jgi:hypothetical protein